jgi:hypothetical protein
MNESIIFNTQLKKALEESFKELGFKLSLDNSITLLKQEQSHIDFIHVFTGIDKITEQYNFIVEAGRKLNIIDQYWEEYRIEPMGLRKGDFPTIIVNEMNKYIPFTQLPAETEELIPLVTLQIREFWERILLPMLDKYSNIKELDKFENSVIGKAKILNIEGSWFKKMIIARLAGNPLYDQLYLSITEMYLKAITDYPEEKPYYENNLWVAEQVNEKLKSLEPLKNQNLLNQ